MAKMGEELRKANGASSEAELRERVRALKTLCEVILDEPSQADQSQAKQVYASSDTMQVKTYPAEPIQPAAINQPKKLKMDDEANGDSLFDF